MKRFLVVGGFLALGIALTVISFLVRNNRTAGENMVRERGQTPTQPPTVTLNRGRIGYEPDPELGEHTWSGTLVDAGCVNRDAVSPGAPDVRSRVMDPACSVTGATRGLALLLPGGALKNLDEGGNTLAMQAFEGSAQGQAVLNGRSPGAKPNVTIVGVDHGDRIVVTKVTTS